MDELQVTSEKRTPIEVLLKMDANRMVSAKALYEFLELAPTQYARWCKDNITDNVLVEEGDEYSVVESFRHNVEKGGRPTNDYLLTIDFAKELCMTCKTDRGRQARLYFKRCEKALVATVDQLNQLKEQVLVLNQQNQEILSIVQNHDDSITKLNSGRSVSGGQLSVWAKDRDEKLDELAKAMEYSKKDLLTRLIREMEEEFGIVFQRWMEAYKRDNPDCEGSPWRICVLDYYDDLEDYFDEVLLRYLDRYGIDKGSSEFDDEINFDDPIKKYGDDPAFWRALERSAELAKEEY